MSLELFFNENYIAFIILAGLFVIMFAYRDVHIPAGKNFILIAIVILVMCIAHCIEHWASLSPDRLNMRIISSVVHYILQPLVFYLELIIIIPESDKEIKSHKLLLALPIIANTIIYLIALGKNELVFWYDAEHIFHRAALGYSIYVVTLIYFLLLMQWSMKYLKVHDTKRSIMLHFMLVVAVITGILEAINIAPGYIDEAFAFGALMYYVYLVTIYDGEMQASLAKKDLELTQNKLTLLRQQIRPHFVFNSLHIIKSLIRSDQSRAITAIEDFSEYLRANVNAIESDKLIMFEEELSLIEAYTSLALADRSKNITIEYDIQEHYFRIPPLTVEPIVENAIKHGLRYGGILSLSTRRDGNDIVIVVSDNGVGFDESNKNKDESHKSTGLENVRTRLREQCNGTLDITSHKDGTDVTIRLPQHERNMA